MTDHELKCWPKFYEAIIDGRKTFEVRWAPRGTFNEGDTLYLHEYDPLVDEYTGRACRVEIGYVTHLDQIGVRPHQEDGYPRMHEVCYAMGIHNVCEVG